MVLIAGDGGHVQLAVIADSLHNTAELVVALDGLAQGLVRGVHAVIVMEEIQDVGLDLCLVMVNTVFRLLNGTSMNSHLKRSFWMISIRWRCS